MSADGAGASSTAAPGSTAALKERQEWVAALIATRAKQQNIVKECTKQRSA